RRCNTEVGARSTRERAGGRRQWRCVLSGPMATPDIGRSIELLTERKVRFALATVVSVRGSAYRRPGARAVRPVGGDPIGSLSPGCLEAELVEDARWVAESGRPALREFDLTGEDEVELGYGMGCQGVVEVFLEPPRTAAAFAHQ